MRQCARATTACARRATRSTRSAAVFRVIPTKIPTMEQLDLPPIMTRLAELEVLSAAKITDLLAPGQVLVRLAVAGVGVSLPPED